jgi:hypothetical protein
VFASLGVVVAAPIACPTGASLATLIALPTTGPNAGCQSQDKIFSNFAYSPLTGGVSASNITAGLVFQQVGGTTDIHGWNFIPTVGSWGTGFTLSFTISVATGNPGVSIFASKDQIDTGLVPNNIVMTDIQTGVGTLTTTGASTAAETLQVSYPGLQSITTTSTATITGGNGLLSLEQEWFENIASSTPEPAAMFLVGTGLLGLSLLRRRKHSA